MNGANTRQTGGRSRSTTTRVVILAALAVLGVGLGVAGSTVAAADDDDPVTDAVIVDIDGDGDAVVSVTVPFDLTDEDEATDFEAFADSEAEQQAHRDQYETRLSSVAAEMEHQTGQETEITDTSIGVQTLDDGTVGLVVLTATWEGLAEESADRLVLGPPFDSGFETDRTVVVDPPEQHRVVSASPTPTEEGETLRWNDETALGGFELVVESDADAGDDTGDETAGDGATNDNREQETPGDDATGPGFGLVVAALGLLSLGGWVRTRGSR